MRPARVFPILLCAGALAAGEYSHKHEVGLTLGRLLSRSRSEGGNQANLDSGIALQANYGHRIVETRYTALSLEMHFLANGQREIFSPDASVTRDVATLYVSPGLRFKLFPRGRVSPYLAGGAGYALYEQSFFQLSGADNPAPRFTHRGVVVFGGGADVPLWRYVAIRGEIRDFYSGSPSFNLPGLRGGQHNVVVGGGFVLRWR